MVFDHSDVVKHVPVSAPFCEMYQMNQKLHVCLQKGKHDHAGMYAFLVKGTDFLTERMN